MTVNKPAPWKLVNLIRSMRTWLTLIILSLAAFASGCERPFVEEVPAAFKVEQPESFEHVFTQSSLPLRIDVSALKAVRRVTVNGEEMSFQDGVWQDTVRLGVGVNALPLVAYGDDGVSGRDTLYAAHLVHALNTVPGVLPEPRGGHATTRLQDGSLLVTGGAPRIGAGASGKVFLRPPGVLRAHQLGATLVAPRTGHTATRLPDGRVLLLGGSRAAAPASEARLVRTAEIYDPGSQTFQRLLVQGTPPRRTQHVAFLLRRTPTPVVAIQGGLGPIGEDVLPRRDLRAFKVQDDSLVALNSARGLPLQTPIAGHTLTPLSDDQFLFAGSYFNADGPGNVTFRLDTSNLNNLRPRPAPAFRTPRTRHAAARVAGNDVLFFGGKGPNGAVLRDVELHAPRVMKAFPVPGDTPPPGFAFTATKYAPHRILLLGGFSRSGAGRAYGVFFDISE